jgi:putative ATP-binding cassette transporter
MEHTTKRQGDQMTRATRFLGSVWALARPYWFSEDRWAGRGLLAVLVALNLGLVYLNVLFNQWNNAFYNTLQDKNLEAFWAQLVRFTWLAATFIVVAVYQLYLNQMLQIRWRRWLTDRYIAAWLADRAYYRMQLAGGSADNPDQRIAEDTKLFVARTLTLSLGLMSAVVTLVSFIAILWGLSGALVLPVGAGISVPGYMVWVALVYAVVGTWLTAKIGRPLVRLNFDQQRYEADFRFSLVRLRENAEGVALYAGEPDEHRNFRARFAEVVSNWWGIMRRQKRLTWFTAGYNQVAIIFPFVVAAPRFFRGEIPLGGLMQTALAFGEVQRSLSFIVNAYTEIAEWQSVVDRLTGFEAAIERARQEVARGGIRVGAGGDGAVSLEQVDLALPDGQPLLDGVTLTLAPGDTVLLTGPSGAGKSTLFRAIAGIWPFGAGAVRRPTGARILFLPQKPYLPVGTLREVVTYPTPAGGIGDAAVVEALQLCGLPQLATRLDESGNWALHLSPGEQQRIAFARALVQQPDWLFLDEATSAVDEGTEARLYALVRERMPATTVISIGHRPTLAPFHARRLVIAPADNGGPPRLAEPEAHPAAR